MAARKERGKSISAPEWWLEIARPRLGQVPGLVKLGKQLAKLVGRSQPYNHGALSKFIRDEPDASITEEFVRAVSLYLDIPPPVFNAKTLDEANAMLGIARAYGSAPPQKPRSPDAAIRSGREAQAFSAIDDLEELVDEDRPQTGAVPSADADEERRPRRGGSGSIRKRRPPPT